MSKILPKQRPLLRGPARPSAARVHLDGVLQRVQSLLGSNQIDEAIDLLETNRGRLSPFAQYRAALATLYGEVGRHQDAAVQARIALDLDPRHEEYYLLAAVSYFAAGYFSFAQRARQQWLHLAPRGPLLAEMQRLDAEYRAGSEKLRSQYGLRDSKVAEDAAYLLDEGRWALAQNRWAEALAHSRAAAKLLPKWPPPRNNVSSALFFLGRYPEAISEAKAVLQDCDRDNLHAQANLVRYHVITGDLRTADRYADGLARLPLPDDMEGVIKQIEGLAFRDRDADIDRILTAARKRFGELPAVAYVHWGIAAANAGRRRDALAHLRRARESEDTALLRSTLDALERNQPGPGISDRYPQTHFVDLVTLGAVEEAGKQLVRDEKQGFRDKRAWDDLLHRYPQLPLVAGRMLYEVPASVGPMAQLLAGLRTTEAIETLRGFVSGQLGSREDRTQVLLIMQQTGILPPGTQIEMWIDGERHPIQSVLQTISDEFVPDYSPKVWELYGRALTAHREGRIAEAERLYEAMLRAEPKAKEAYNNLASIYHQRGDIARADEYMDKALAIDPFYPFPHTSRASQALAKGDLTAAKAWLEPLHNVQKWHPLGFVAYQKAMARVAIEEKEYKTAREHLEMTKQFIEDDPEVDDLLNWLSLAELAGQFGDSFREYDERSRQRRLHKPLPVDPTLADCLHILSKGDMDGIAGVVGLRLRHPYKRADIEQHLLARFPDPDFLAIVVRDLNEAERAALEDLLVHGGVMEREAFIQVHGDEGDDRPYLEYHGSQMKSVKGRLRARGLLFEGTARERGIVATPRELRPLLQQALNSATQAILTERRP